ncbi:protein lin-54 homolog [Toxorhynchites rutilus septentrionalis]|uniref:protein lin-54 homolog n=1 Tax=Toxorhynchites rutilus septentrionalis TaxID=329112 RepID=UPI0024796E91|nr:protein lin-54 homolog [Toxorhynchites rutilus septentrionalis]
MEVDEDYSIEDQSGFEEIDMDGLEEETIIGSDDLVEYSAGEEEPDEEIVYVNNEVSVGNNIQNALNSNITVKRLINASKPVVTTLQKIAPKPTQLIRAANTTGKVVIMQKQPTTSSVPVKVLNNSKPLSVPVSSTSYHLIKSEGGGVVMRPKTGTPTMVRRVVPISESSTALTKSKIIPSASTHVVIQTKAQGSTGTTTKTVTVAEAHQMGLLNNKVKQMVTMAKPKPSGSQIASKSPVKILSNSSGGPNSNASVVRLRQPQPSIQEPPQKVIIKANSVTAAPKASVQSRKVLLPQSAIQAGQQSGQIQAINIPGKGIQYVRFLNHSSGSSSGTSGPSVGSGQKVLQVQMNKTGSGSKIIVQNDKTYVVSNGNVTAVRAGSNSSQLVRTVTPGAHTLVRKTIHPGSNQTGIIRKEGEPTRYYAVMRKEDSKPSDTITALTGSQINQLKSGPSGKTKILMVPSEHNQAKAKVGTVSLAATLSSTACKAPAIISVKRESISGSDDEARKGPAIGTIFPDEAYKKRPCNCTKSQCLKLYCDCFANGEFCYNCNCRDCYNNLENEEERQKAIRATLERNPSAFKPKIGAVSAAEDALRQHTKGCNCKRSGCLKNYCECYEAKIPCSGNCKCIGCRNTEQYAKEYEYASGGAVGGEVVAAGIDTDVKSVFGDLEKRLQSGDEKMAEGVAVCAGAGTTSTSLAAPVAGNAPGPSGTSTATAGMKRSLSAEPDLTQLPPSKQPYNFMTPDVIEATVQCMIAQADECQKRGCNIRTAERMILEEFGRCLVEIIDFSTKSDS